MGRFVLLASTSLFLGYTKTENWTYGWTVLGYGMLLADLFFARKKPRIPILSVGLFTQSLAWSFYGTWWMAGAMIGIDALHNLAMRVQSIELSQAGIRFSFPWPRRTDWSAIEFIILKDGLLTIEYKNGRVFQQPIQKDTSLNEADFNEFCQQQCNP